MRRQRLYGLALLGCSGALLALGGDCTAVLALAPLGLWLLCRRRRLLWSPKKESAPPAATDDAQDPKGAVPVGQPHYNTGGGQDERVS